ncbi:hypothetical protein E2562_035147 [Oryza meyeriana var. granulata]|uniref:Uncharacterized protein n=1 Tax=Oryza meyeriana var. granulata TaxID=110450 RepID=A0A6G1F1R6_9ORYZ|nr:hypothetical protein E2562_035147 [Oryza meyeriana var. granulata]
MVKRSRWDRDKLESEPLRSKRWDMGHAGDGMEAREQAHDANGRDSPLGAVSVVSTQEQPTASQETVFGAVLAKMVQMSHLAKTLQLSPSAARSMGRVFGAGQDAQVVQKASGNGSNVLRCSSRKSVENHHNVIAVGDKDSLSKALRLIAACNLDGPVKGSLVAEHMPLQCA